MNLHLVTRLVFAAGMIPAQFALATAAGAETPASSSGSTAAPSDPRKPFTLFMGTDFSVEHGKEFYHVRDVSEGTFVIYVKGEPVFKAINGPRKVGLRVEPSLKLTETSATVANLKSERAYTPANDPTKKFLREQPGNAMAAIQDAAGANSRNLAFKAAEINANPHSTELQKRLADRDAQMAGQADRLTYMPTENLSASYHAGKMEQELQKELFDAVSVKFDLSAETPLNHPYVAIITAFREKGAKPNEIHDWIYAKELSPIEPAPRAIKILQGGLPPGFELVSCEVHLYNNGNEVATNVAAKRVPLSRDEAFDFVLMEYIGAHKGATLAPIPAMAKLPPDLHARIIKGEYADQVYIKVAKDGRPLAVFADESCAKTAADPYLEALVKGVRFKPALANGKPVEGVAELRLNKLLSL